MRWSTAARPSPSPLADGGDGDHRTGRAGQRLPHHRAGCGLALRWPTPATTSHWRWLSAWRWRAWASLAPDWQITLHSDIPVASGMGSGGAEHGPRACGHAGPATAEPAEVSDLVHTKAQLPRHAQRYRQHRRRLWHAHLVCQGPTARALRAGPPDFAGHCRQRYPQPYEGDRRRCTPRERRSGALRGHLRRDRPHRPRRAVCAGSGAICSNWARHGCKPDSAERLDVSSPVLATLIGAAWKAGALGAKLAGAARRQT